MTMPTPPIFCIDDPSVCIVQRVCSSWFSSSSSMMNFSMKLASAWTFMAIQSLYSISNWLSLIAHYTICLTTSGLFIAFIDGLICHYYDWIHLKVWIKLLRSYVQGECDLLHAWVPGLNSIKSLADVVHQALHPLIFPN